MALRIIKTSFMCIQVLLRQICLNQHSITVLLDMVKRILTILVLFLYSLDEVFFEPKTS